jgi:hypothetical protein
MTGDKATDMLTPGGTINDVLHGLRHTARTLLDRALLLPLLVVSCGSDPVWSDGGLLRALFVGNSLTYFNDLPGMLERMASADGFRRLETLDVSQASYSLQDHWGDPNSRAALAEGGWGVVIMQQGPSSLPENRENLVTWTRTWAEAIRAQGGVPALYMVWPDRSRLDFFDDVSVSYRTAAAEADTELYPAGDAWRAAWDEQFTLPLYGPDDFHPSVMGTYLAALTIYRGLTGRDPPSLTGLGISAADDAILQRAARTAVEAVTSTISTPQ